MSSAKLAAAKELIQERYYDAARAVLVTMSEDKTAQAWLQKLPKAKRQPPIMEVQPERRRIGCRSLVAYIIVGFVCLMIGVGIGMTPTPKTISPQTAAQSLSTAAPSATITDTAAPNLASTQAWIDGEQTRAALGLTADAANIGLTRTQAVLIVEATRAAQQNQAVPAAQPTDIPFPTYAPPPAQPAQPIDSDPFPDNCSTAVAEHLSPQQAAQYPGLDRNNNGVACYGS